MTEQQKPTDGAVAAGTIISERHGMSTLAENDAIAIIDREAVAPAVRELAGMIGAVLTRGYRLPEDDQDAIDRRTEKEMLELIARYRHLLETE